MAETKKDDTKAQEQATRPAASSGDKNVEKPKPLVTTIDNPEGVDLSKGDKNAEPAFVEGDDK